MDNHFFVKLPVRNYFKTGLRVSLLSGPKHGLLLCGTLPEIRKLSNVLYFNTRRRGPKLKEGVEEIHQVMPDFVTFGRNANTGSVFWSLNLSPTVILYYDEGVGQLVVYTGKDGFVSQHLLSSGLEGISDPKPYRFDKSSGIRDQIDRE